MYKRNMMKTGLMAEDGSDLNIETKNILASLNQYEKSGNAAQAYNQSRAEYLEFVKDPKKHFALQAAQAEPSTDPFAELTGQQAATSASYSYDKKATKYDSQTKKSGANNDYGSPEDMISFITVTDKQKEYASQATMPTIASSNQGKNGKSSKDGTMRHVPTGMSYYADRRSSQVDDEDSDEELPVTLPAPFKKTRQEK